MKAANIIRIIVCVFLIAGIATAVTYRKQFDVDVLGDWLAGAGVMAPLLFIGIYAISTVLDAMRLQAVSNKSRLSFFSL